MYSELILLRFLEAEFILLVLFLLVLAYQFRHIIHKANL